MWDYITPIVVLLWTYITEGNAVQCSVGTYYKYCTSKCCGISTAEYCCLSDSTSYSYSSYSYISYTISGGVIAGAVIGSIIFVGVIIAIIVCVCIASRAGRFGAGGRIIRTPGQATVVTTTVGSQQMYPAGQVGLAPAGPVYYNNAGFAHDTYTGANPAQPPTNYTPLQYPIIAPGPAQAPYPTQGASPIPQPPPYPEVDTPEKSAPPVYM